MVVLNQQQCPFIQQGGSTLHNDSFFDDRRDVTRNDDAAVI
jgi:hypothetical protein